jgi:DNA-binding NarL/FixJ family response regulator
LNEDARASAYLHLLEEGLKSITASMPDQLTTFFDRLTPSEKDIAMMTMSGQTTKGIARIMSREPSTIEFHRNNIRKKLGLNKSGQNLRSKLLSIQKTWG